MIEVATKTPQIMYREELGIPLLPDYDYIELKKDHSNMTEVMDRVSDAQFLETIAENCFVKLKEHTNYEKLFTELYFAIEEVSKTPNLEK